MGAGSRSCPASQHSQLLCQGKTKKGRRRQGKGTDTALSGKQHSPCWSGQTGARRGKGGTGNRRFEFPVSAGLRASSPRLVLLPPLLPSASTSAKLPSGASLAPRGGQSRVPPFAWPARGTQPGSHLCPPRHPTPPVPSPLPGTGTCPSAALSYDRHGCRGDPLGLPGRSVRRPARPPRGSGSARRRLHRPPGAPAPLPAALTLRWAPAGPNPPTAPAGPYLAPARVAARPAEGSCPLPVLLPVPLPGAAPAAFVARAEPATGGRLRPCPSASLGTLRHKLAPRTRSRTHAHVQTRTGNGWH